MGVMAAAGQNYEEFYAAWKVRQEGAMKELQLALEEDMQDEALQSAVAKAEKLYQSYYDAMDEAAKQNVLQVVTPSWKTPLEKAFLWLGEWRPSATYQLVYALAGQKVEEELADLLAGIETPSLASLSAVQLSQISEMQMRTLKEEELLQHHKALLQQSIAGQPMLGLVQAIKMEKSAEECTCKATSDDQMNGEHIKGGEKEHEGDQEDGEGCEGQQIDENYGTEGLFKCAMHDKLKRLEELSLRADSLRRRTLAGLLEVLNTVQSAQFLLASTQLQVAVRELGEKMKQKPQVIL